MYRALIIDNDSAHADRLLELMRPRSLSVDRVADSETGIAKLRRYAGEYVLVIVPISDSRLPWCRTLAKLQAACRSANDWSVPFFLCVGRTDLRPGLILRLERLGVRYVRER